MGLNQGFSIIFDQGLLRRLQPLENKILKGQNRPFLFMFFFTLNLVKGHLGVLGGLDLACGPAFENPCTKHNDITVSALINPQENQY